MSEEKGQDVAEEPKFENVSDFLEATPPNRVSHISDLSEHKSVNGYCRNILNTPDIQLHCPSDACNGIRFFRCISGKGAEKEK